MQVKSTQEVAVKVSESSYSVASPGRAQPLRGRDILITNNVYRLALGLGLANRVPYPTSKSRFTTCCHIDILKSDHLREKIFEFFLLLIGKVRVMG